LFVLYYSDKTTFRKSCAKQSLGKVEPNQPLEKVEPNQPLEKVEPKLLFLKGGKGLSKGGKG